MISRGANTPERLSDAGTTRVGIGSLSQLSTPSPDGSRLQPVTTGGVGDGGSDVGYSRVGLAYQSTVRQLDGVAVDRVFTDHLSGATRNRPALEALRRYVREFTDAGIAVEFVKEHTTFTGADSPMRHLMLNLPGGSRRIERSLIRECQREGIELAKKRGVHKGRRPSLTADQVSEMRAQAAAGIPKTELARQFGIHRDTVYRYLAADGT